MSEAVGVAMIGTGMWGKRMAGAIERTPSLRLVTCYSRDQSKRETFAAQHNCEASATFEAAVTNPDVQGVLLLTPNSIHARHTVAAAEKDRHVFVEKPIADEISDGLAMQRACEAAGVTLMVGHAFRRLGAARKVKQLVDAGTLGQIVLAEANFSLPGTLTPEKWRYYRETCPGGPLMQLGVHHADTLQYWIGPVDQVHGTFAHLATPAEIDDVGIARLVFANGAQGILSGSYVSAKTYYLRLYGTEANLTYETDMSIWPQAEKMDEATSLTLQTKSDMKAVQFPKRDMLVDELGEFAECIRGNRVPETDAAAGLAALEVIRGAIASHESGQVYKVGRDN